MITYQEALAMIQASIQTLREVYIPLSKSGGRVLARAIQTPIDLPMFTNTAVDGYAVRLSNWDNLTEPIAPVTLSVVGQLQAGEDPSSLQLLDGQTIQVFTGAALPHGTEAVVMQEFTTPVNPHQIQFNHHPRAQEHMRHQGEEFQKGDTVINSGTVISPAVAGQLAALGLDHTWVYDLPKVHLLITGNELVPAGMLRQAGQIYESNSVALEMALRQMGICQIQTTWVPDSQEDTQTALANALMQADVIITSGGVSVGQHDWVKSSLEVLGVETRFWQVAIKPGKPVYFGGFAQAPGQPQKWVFGLPGNPASVLVTYSVFVKPALGQLMGYPPSIWHIQPATLTEPLSKRKGRLELVRGCLRTQSNSPTLTVTPTQGQGSHMLSGFINANGLIIFEADQTELIPGQTVSVIPLQWGGVA